VEDLHWVDPSTVELLSLLIDQCAQMRLCLVLTARPEFHPPWAMVAHLTALTLRRLAPAEIGRLVTHVVGDKAFPPAVLQEVVRKTDGVPLFVEELTKTVLASGLLQEREDCYELSGTLPPLAIPATLHDALMARLDRLAAVKVVAQLGAAIGRTFTYELIQAVAQLDAATLQGALALLVETEVRGAAGSSAPGDLHVQAHLDSGRGVSVPAAQYPAAVSPAACAGLRGAVSRHLRDPTRTVGPPLYRGRPECTGPSLLATGGSARHGAFGLP
jgi:hypothetical protein